MKSYFNQILLLVLSLLISCVPPGGEGGPVILDSIDGVSGQAAAEFESATTIMREGSSGNLISIRLSKALDENVSLRYNITGQSRNNSNSDFTTMTGIIFLEKSTIQKNIYFNVKNDSIIGSDRIYEMNLSVISGQVKLSSLSKHQIIVKDDDIDPNVNQAPIAVDDQIQLTIGQGEQAIIEISDLIKNDHDNEDGKVIFDKITDFDITKGIVSRNSSSVIFVPMSDFQESQFVFEYQVKDRKDATSKARVTLNILWNIPLPVGSFAINTPTNNSYTSSSKLRIAGQCVGRSTLDFSVNGNNITISSTKTDSSSSTSGDTWSVIDADGVGASALDGSESDSVFTINNGDLHLSGYGDDIWGSDLQFVGLSQDQLRGDFDVSVQVKSMTGSSEVWAKAGLMVYNDLDKSEVLLLGMMNKRGVAVVADLRGSPSLEQDNVIGNELSNVFLRIKKRGTSLSLYYKRNKNDSWVGVPNNPYNIKTLGANARLALVSSAHTDREKMTTVFSPLRDESKNKTLDYNVNATNASNWAVIDADGKGKSDITGQESDDVARFQNQDLVLSGYGDDLWGSTLEFVGLKSKQAKGNFDVSVQVKSMSISGEPWAKAGLLIFDDLSKRNAFFFGKNYNNGLAAIGKFDGNDRLQSRSIAGNNSDSVFLRVKKEGTNLNLYYKVNQSDSWIASVDNPYKAPYLSSASQLAIITTSHSDSKKITSTFGPLVDEKSKQTLSYQVEKTVSNLVCDNGNFDGNIELPKDDNNYRVEVKQSSGDSIQVKRVNVIKDTIEPEVFISNVDLRIEKNFRLIGICEVGLTIGLDGVNIRNAACPSNGILDLNVTTNANPGSNQGITITQTDRAGNIGTMTKRFTIIDKDPNTNNNQGNPIGTPRQRFEAGIAVINSKTTGGKCLVCHDSGSNVGDFSKLRTEKDWIDSPYVSPGKYSSPLIQYLKHSGGIPASMPLGFDFARSDFEKVRDWIMGLEEEDTQGQDLFAKSQFVCRPEAIREDTITRLSRDQYVNSLRVLLGDLSNNEKNNIMNDMRGILDTIPQDQNPTGEEQYTFTKMDYRVSQNHVAQTIDVAETYAGLIFKNDNTANRFMGKFCSSNYKTDNSCLDKFIDGFGLRTLRRPPTAAEKQMYRQLYNEVDRGYEAVLMAMLMSEDFLYHNYTNGNLNNGVFTLTPYELVSKLAFTYWDEMPDDTLFQMARSNFNMNNAINHVFSNNNVSKIKKNFESMYYQWLSLDRVPDVDAIKSDTYKFLTRDTRIGQNGHNHQEEMIQEINDMFEYYTFDKNLSFQELFTSNRSFAKKDGLAAIYKMPKWNGSSEPPVFPSDRKRAGFLTRAGFLAQGIASTNPFITGAIIKRRILCDTLEGPEGSVSEEEIAEAQAPYFSPFMSTRERFQAKIAGQPVCLSCHVNFQDLGFAMESYDFLGRARKVSGNVGFQKVGVNPKEGTYREVPFELTVEPRAFIDDNTETVGAVNTINHLALTGKPQACYTQQVYTFLSRNLLDEEGDGCGLEQFRQKVIDNNVGLLDALKEYARIKNFKVRRVK